MNLHQTYTYVLVEAKRDSDMPPFLETAWKLNLHAGVQKEKKKGKTPS
jgi:hypothetical protein